MELELLFYSLLYSAIAWISSHFILTAFKRSKYNPKRQPPGPFPLPIVGNIFSFGSEPRKALTSLAKTYGSVMSLHLGYHITIVVSSASMAKEVLQTNDASFANRYVPEALTAINHHNSSVALCPANDRWKVYRKICTSHVFASSRLDATHALRKKKVEDLLSYVQSNSENGNAVNIGQAAFTTSLNFLSNTFFSIDLGDPNSEIAREFKMLVRNLAIEAGVPNIADFFPVFKWIDPQRIKKRTTAILEKIMAIFDKMISERLEERKLSNLTSRKSDVLDALLSLVQEGKDLQLWEVRHLMFDLFAAGTETTSTSMEWTMAELLRNPKKMKKAQAELENVIGKGNQVEEKDATRLPYLQAVIKETLRMHPPGPYLVPRIVYKDTPLGDFIVPKNAQILVNVHSIHKDPSLWNNPDSFQPERFMGSSIDFKGQDFEFLPFGSGRRICPGVPLANRMLLSMLGSLIHVFDWKLESGVTPETLDMEEKLGFSMNRATPMRAIPVRK